MNQLATIELEGEISSTNEDFTTFKSLYDDIEDIKRFDEETTMMKVFRLGRNFYFARKLAEDSAACKKVGIEGATADKRFSAYCKSATVADLNIPSKTAFSYRSAYLHFGHRLNLAKRLPLQTIYALSSPSCDEFREELIKNIPADRILKGRNKGYDVDNLIRDFKNRLAPPPEPAPNINLPPEPEDDDTPPEPKDPFKEDLIHLKETCELLLRIKKVSPDVEKKMRALCTKKKLEEKEIAFCEMEMKRIHREAEEIVTPSKKEPTEKPKSDRALGLIMDLSDAQLMAIEEPFTKAEAYLLIGKILFAYHNVDPLLRKAVFKVMNNYVHPDKEQGSESAFVALQQAQKVIENEND